MIGAVTAFLSGLLYTSFFTAPLSILLLVSIDPNANPYFLAAVAGLGAVLGDLIIIKVLKIIFAPFSFLNHQNSVKAFKKQLEKYHLNIISVLLGAIIVASPLPDELGLILLGFSGLSYMKLAVLTFLLNGLGLLIIILGIQALR